MTIEPTEAQKKAGNYKKRHDYLHGMRISVENEAGSVRRGTDKAGTPWEQELAHDYGYVRGSKGRDKDKLDVFLGPMARDPEAKVYVIDQMDDEGGFDEHKAVLGALNAAHARDIYGANYPSGWSKGGAVTEMPISEFRKWVYVGKDGGKRLPASELKAFRERAQAAPEMAHGGLVNKTVPKVLTDVPDSSRDAHAAEHAYNIHDPAQAGQELRPIEAWQDNPAEWEEIMRWVGPEASAPKYAGGGAVKKAAMALSDFLKARNLEHLAPSFDKVLQRTEKTGNEHGFLASSDDDKAPRVFAGKQEEIKLPTFANKSGNQTHVHSHPPDTQPFASPADVAVWSRNEGDRRFISESANNMIVRPGAKGVRPAYTSSGINPGVENARFADYYFPGTPRHDINTHLKGAQQDGVFKGVIGDDKELEYWFPAMRQLLGHSYFDELGMTNSAFDVPTRSGDEKFNRAIEQAWPIAHDVLKTTKPGGYAAGGVVAKLAKLAERVLHADRLVDSTGVQPLSAADKSVRGWHVTTDDALSDIFRSGAIDNSRAGSNVQGYDPTTRGGAYMWSSPGIARAKRAELMEQGGLPDAPVLRLKANRSRHAFAPDEDAGNVPWEQSRMEGSFATQTPFTLDDIEAIYSADPDGLRQSIQRMSRPEMAAGGVVAKAAKPLKRWLEEVLKLDPTSTQGLADRIKSAALHTFESGREHGGSEYTQELKRLQGRMPITRGEDTHIRIPEPWDNIEQRYNEMGEEHPFLYDFDTLNFHTHPVGSSPMPSRPGNTAMKGSSDYQAWGRRSATPIEGGGKLHALIVQPHGRNPDNYTARTIGASDLYEGSAEYSPMLRGAEALRLAGSKGAFDDVLKATQDADPARFDDRYAFDPQRAIHDQQYLRGFLNDAYGFLPHSYIDDKLPNISSSDYNLADPAQRELIQRAWPKAYEILNDEWKGKAPDIWVPEYASGGSVEQPCACHGALKHAFADGGTVGGSTGGGAYTGARGRRRAKNNDREGAKEVPVQLLRGALAGTLGFGGDMEGLARMFIPGVDDTSFLPNSDFYSDVLPLAPTSAVGKAAGSVGSAAGAPLSVPVLRGVRAAQKAAPAAARLAEGLGPQVEAALAKWAPAAQPMYAVKPKGGNWMDTTVDMAANATRGWEGEGADTAVNDWLENRVKKYMRNDMGTATDPLLQLEKEGNLHLKPDQLQGNAVENSKYSVKGRPGWEAGDDLEFVGDETHKDLTGRDTRTAWEALTDTYLFSKYPEAARQYFRLPGPDWLNKLSDDDKVWGVKGFDELPGTLGFSHIRDYLDQATEANNSRRMLEGDITVLAERDPKLHKFLSAGLDIDPAKLSKMSLPDVARKTAEWNRAMERWAVEAAANKDWNAGVKSVLKQYGPETNGGQWVELSPEALADEGTAMGHCVGGYCSRVQGGNTRILSYRDKEGPHITAELEAPRKTNPSQFWTDNAELQTRHPYPSESGAFGDERQAWLKAVSESPEYKAHVESLPWSIRQIKGKGNEAPVAKYQPMAQDLVRELGPWGDVSDLRNTGLTDLRNGHPSLSNDYIQQQFGVRLPEEGGFHTPQSLREALEAANPDTEVSDDLIYTLTGARTRGFAAGGSTGAGNTVGLGTYSPSAQGQRAPVQGFNPYAQQQPGVGVRPPQTAAPAAQPAGAANNPYAANYAWMQAQGMIDPNNPATVGTPGSAMEQMLSQQQLNQMGGMTPQQRADYEKGFSTYYNPNYGTMFNGKIPTDPLATAGQPGSPSALNMNTPEGQMGLRAMLETSSAGQLGSGLRAFTNPLYDSPWLDKNAGNFMSFGGDAGEQAQWEANFDPLINTAKQTGFDLSGYDLDPAQRRNPGNVFGVNLLPPTAGEQKKGAQDLYNDLDNYLKDYHMVRTMSSNYGDLSRGERGAANILYKDDGSGVWNPVYVGDNGRAGVQREHKGWAREDGAPFVAALSTILPAFGGWAGIASNLAPGAYGAAAGAIGNTATNAIINGLGSYALTGSATGALGALGGALGGAGGAALGGAMDPAYAALGKFIGTQAGSNLAKKAA